MSRPPSRSARATMSMTMAISGRALRTAEATLASSWLMMRAISSADLVSRPSDADVGGFGGGVVGALHDLHVRFGRVRLFHHGKCCHRLLPPW